MADKVRIIAIVNKINSKHRVFDSNYRTCNFTLANGTSVYCDGFIPMIREGWRVEVVGEWSKDKADLLLADEVERYDKTKAYPSKKKKSKFPQTKEKQNKLFGDDVNE